MDNQQQPQEEPRPTGTTETTPEERPTVNGKTAKEISAEKQMEFYKTSGSAEKQDIERPWLANKNPNS